MYTRENRKKAEEINQISPSPLEFYKLWDKGPMLYL